MQTYCSIIVPVNEMDVEVLMALINEVAPIEGFFEEDGVLNCYILQDEYQDQLLTSIASIANVEPSQLSHQNLPNRNYNAEWEASFEPVLVDDFCAVLADFHTTKHQCDYEVRITPKMAFGTGHHATTYMMIQSMRSIEFVDKKVFDFGAGTGILSVLASKLGADSIVANDIQPEAVENIKEHVLLNDCQAAFTILEGGIDVVIDHPYDIILANINTVVLRQDAEAVYSRLQTNGDLLLSGILQEKSEEIQQIYNSLGLQLINTKQRGDWVCLHYRKC